MTTPAMRPPRKGVSYSEALAAAYATAPESEIPLDTLEWLHPLFVDGPDSGQVGVRFVNDHEDLLAFLEPTAPLNGGEEVLFKAMSFQITRPQESDSGNLPEIEITVNNVSRVLIPYLELVKESRVPITVIWRPYLPSNLSGPHALPVFKWTVKTIGGSMTQLTARAGFGDFSNLRFPRSEYTSAKFPGVPAR